MSSFTYLQTAKIDKILDLHTGLTLDATTFVGNDDRALLLRSELMKDIIQNIPRYVCPACFKPIYLRSNPQKTGQYFAHYDTEGNCPKLEKEQASQEQIRAIKYNGAKESIAHKKTKQLLVDSLNADSLFSQVAAEQIWKGEMIEGRFRRPDVRATYHGPAGDIKVAFEVQLSTTFLSEIVGRTEFYRKENALIIWILRNFSREEARLTQLDIFYPNNLNAFVVNQKTRDCSLQTSQFLLHCHWGEPHLNNAAITKQFADKIVSFKDLSIIQEKQQIFHYDYLSAEKQLQKEQAKQLASSLVIDFKRYCTNNNWSLTDPNFNRFRGQFLEAGISVPDFSFQLHRMVKALYSLEKGKVVGFGYTHLIQCGNLLYNNSPDLLVFFLVASKAYGRINAVEDHGNKEKWAAKKKEVWEDICNNSASRFAWDNDLANFIFVLFPQIEPALKELSQRVKSKLTCI